MFLSSVAIIPIGDQFMAIARIVVGNVTSSCRQGLVFKLTFSNKSSLVNNAEEDTQNPRGWLQPIRGHDVASETNKRPTVVRPRSAGGENFLFLVKRGRAGPSFPVRAAASEPGQVMCPVSETLICQGPVLSISPPGPGQSRYVLSGGSLGGRILMPMRDAHHSKLNVLYILLCRTISSQHAIIISSKFPLPIFSSVSTNLIH